MAVCISDCETFEHQRFAMASFSLKGCFSICSCVSLFVLQLCDVWFPVLGLRKHLKEYDSFTGMTFPFASIHNLVHASLVREAGRSYFWLLGSCITSDVFAVVVLLQAPTFQCRDHFGCLFLMMRVFDSTLILVQADVCGRYCQVGSLAGVAHL